MTKYAGKFIYELTRADVGKSAVKLPPCSKCGGEKIIWLRDCLGRVQQGDVGKQIYDVGGGVLQAENNEQRDKRQQQE